MHFKKLLVALIATLMLLSVGCGNSSDSEPQDTSVSDDILEKDTVQSSTTEVDSVPNGISKLDTSRFSAEAVDISNLPTSRGDWCVAYIITDYQTGKQYLYVLYNEVHFGFGTSIVELGSTVDVDIVE